MHRMISGLARNRAILGGVNPDEPLPVRNQDPVLLKQRGGQRRSKKVENTGQAD